MQKLKRNLNRNIEDLCDFKTVMHAIKDIQSTNISTELQLHGIQETFAILNEHNIEVSGCLYCSRPSLPAAVYGFIFSRFI